MYQSYVSQLIFEMELRGYSPRTIHSYSKYLHQFSYAYQQTCFRYY